MLPSKKVLIALALLIVGIGAFSWYAYNKNSNIEYTNNETSSVALGVASSSQSTAKEQAYENLPGWKESLNDVMPSTKNSSATSDATPEKLTLTDTFARNFFTQYANLQQSGVKVTSDNADQIASDYLKSTPLPTITAKQYTASDLSLINSNQAELQNYRDAVTAIFAKDWPNGNPNELNIFQQAFVNNNPQALANLSAVIKKYQNTLQDSLDLAVPKLAVSLHLNMVNALSTYIKTLQMIGLAYTDPIAGLAALNVYQTNQANLLFSMGNLRTYFINSIK